jgi:hypothetical protein
MHSPPHRRRFLAAAGSSLLVLGCNLRNGDQPGGPAVAKAADGRSELQLPDGWSVLEDLNDQADLQAGDKRRQTFAIVLTEPKKDFASDITYRELAQRKVKKFQEALEEVADKKGPTDVTVGGRPAAQYEFSAVATKERLRLFYLHTMIDGNTAFHTLLAWTKYSTRDEHRALLEEAIRGFSDLS